MAKRTEPRYQAPVQATPAAGVAARRRGQDGAPATAAPVERPLWQAPGVLDALVELHHPRPPAER